MPDATPDSIRHLDFEVGPVMCGCQGCPAVPRTRQDPPCTSIATHRVAVHAVNDCERDGLVDGAMVQLVCVKCLTARTKRVEAYAAKLQRFYERYNHVLGCSTCGRPLVEEGDLMEVWRIVEG